MSAKVVAGNDITVIVPSFEHGAFIGDAIGSILSQTLQPAKIVVVDDCSSDRSLDVIRSFDDPRITLIVHPSNRGGAAALNTGLEQLDTEFFAILNSDDLWEKDKLEKQYAAIRNHDDVGAVFTLATTIQHSGERADHSRFEAVFNANNTDRHQHLRRLFERGNYLCHPSILARRSAYDVVGHYDNRFRQLPDYHMWLRILQKQQILILQDKLVRFRQHPTNTSKPAAESVTRDRFEWSIILEDFILTVDQLNFCGAFGSLREPADPEFSLTVEKIAYLTTIPGAGFPVYRNIANRMALALLATEAGREEWRAYDLQEKDLFTLTGMPSAQGDRSKVLRLTPSQAELHYHLVGEKPRSRFFGGNP